MGFDPELGSVSIVGRTTTAGVGEQVLNLSLNGAAAAATVAVPARRTLLIADAVLMAEGAARFRVQQTKNGTTFYDILPLRQPTDGIGGIVGLAKPLQIVGSATAAIRVLVETPGGAILVGITLGAILKR